MRAFARKLADGARRSDDGCGGTERNGRDDGGLMRADGGARWGPRPLLPATSYTYEIIYYLDGELSGAGIESPRPWRSGVDAGRKEWDGSTGSRAERKRRNEIHVALK